MKMANSEHAAPSSEGQLRTATSKALAAEKVARVEKEKARSAKRRFKEARKAYKEAKKAAKKAEKKACQAQAELNACVDVVAKEKKRTLMLAKRATAGKAIVPGSRTRQKPKVISPALSPSSNPVSDHSQPSLDTSSSVDAPPKESGDLNT
jgi:ATPase subunit of ABC transporter with duplicated ATPase domains